MLPTIVSDEFLLLGVYGNNRLGGVHLLRHLRVDVLELCIAVGMLCLPSTVLQLP